MTKDCKELVSWLIEHDFQKPEPRENFYATSYHKGNECVYFLVKMEEEKKLVLIERKPTAWFETIKAEREHKQDGYPVKIAPLNHGNACAMRAAHSFMKPVAFGKDAFSLGLGDRLGLASPGHLQTLKGSGIRPILAQQSMRELNLTERSYEDVLDAASWAVLQEGWHDGFGADGDHLKKMEDIRTALGIGYSMITLDCSEKIDNSIEQMTDTEAALRYFALPPETTTALEERYLKKSFKVGAYPIVFEETAFRKIVLTYGSALQYAEEVYAKLIKPHNTPVDFELSIDETATPTSPEAHYFIASELHRANVSLESVAPRFCGEFQKAIDYIGDIAKFEAEFAVHAAIADKFGYRLSIHSGSDKFAVFPIIGQYTRGRVHVKTAGTNWLEALRVVCRREPKLFREICLFALQMFPEATKFYHVTTDLGKVPDVSGMEDKDLESMLNEPDARQLLHITYGYILTDRTGTGYRFRDKLYKLWGLYEQDYADVLVHHIGHHVKLLKSKLS